MNIASFWKRGHFELEDDFFKLARFPAAVWKISEPDKTTEIGSKPEISFDNGDNSIWVVMLDSFPCLLRFNLSSHLKLF